MHENNNYQPTDKLGTIVRNPDEWTTGTEQITGKQASQLEKLTDETKQEIPQDLSGAGAYINIEALKQEKEEGDQ